MANSIIERAMQQLVKELQKIVTPAFETDVKRVRRNVISGETSTVFPFINVIDESDTGTISGPNSPYNFQTRIKTLSVEGWVSGKSKDILTDLANLAADINKAVNVNPQLNDGTIRLVENVILEGFTPAISNDRNNQKVESEVTIMYRTKLTDPYALA